MNFQVFIYIFIIDWLVSFMCPLLSSVTSSIQFTSHSCEFFCLFWYFFHNLLKNPGSHLLHFAFVWHTQRCSNIVFMFLCSDFADWLHSYSNYMVHHSINILFHLLFFSNVSLGSLHNFNTFCITDTKKIKFYPWVGFSVWVLAVTEMVKLSSSFDVSH